MGYTFCPEGVLQRLQSFFLQINTAEILIHKTDEPNAIVNFLDAAWPASALRLIFLLYRQRRPQRVTMTVRSWNG